MTSALTDPIRVIAGSVLVARSLVQAVVEYISSDSSKRKPNGIGLSRDALPEKLPSVVDIKKVIPKHCFQPTVLRSMYYAIKDFVLIAITFCAINLIHRIESPFVWYTSLLAYWAYQGTLFTAIFVIGHDAGHDSFSHHYWLNDVVGTVWHGFLLTPYYTWKLSHRHHHKNTANFDQDEVFYPVRKSEVNSSGKVLPGFGFGLGWFAYLANGYSPRRVPHFTLFHSLFKGHAFGCSMSFLSVGVWGCILWKYAMAYGFWAWFNYYFVPLYIFASYCVIITFLHHSEENIPWFADENWEFVRGQLSTVDRHYGMAHDVIHSIGTHQIHHMFSRVPHYHLEEATRHFRMSFPQLVRICEEPIIPSFLRMFKKYAQQSVMKDDVKVHYYK